MEIGGTSTNITPSSSRNPSPPSSYFASPVSSYQPSPFSSSCPSPTHHGGDGKMPPHPFAFLRSVIPPSLPPLRISSSALLLNPLPQFTSPPSFRRRRRRFRRRSYHQLVKRSFDDEDYDECHLGEY
nr:protein BRASSINAZOLE-RESISTANT 1-like [Ipomoea trifida]